MKTEREFLETIFEKQKEYRRRRRERRQVLAASATVTLCAAAVAATVMLSPRTGRPNIDISTGTTTQANTTTTETVGKDPNKVYVYRGLSDADKNPNEPGIGGANPFRNNPFSFAFDLSWNHINYVGEENFYAWLSQFQTGGGTRPDHEYNLYTFVKEFDVPRSVLEEFWKKDMILYGDQSSDFPTPEQIDVIYNGTEYEVYCAFAWRSTVIVDNSFYAIGWLADHTADEYRAHGITAEQAQAAVNWDVELYPKDRQHILQQIAILNGVPITTTTFPKLTWTTTAKATA